MAPLFLLVAVSLSSPASAQDVSREDLKHCAAMSSDASKLACFEELTASQDIDESSVSLTGEERTTDEMDRGDRLGKPVESSVQSVATSPVSAAADAAQPNRGLTQTVQLDAVDAFGSEDLKNPVSKPETLNATVGDVSVDRLRRLTFHFENGQVWRQQEARRFQYPRGESFDVVISRGLLGDYQLRVGGEGRMTRVRRLK